MTTHLNPDAPEYNPIQPGVAPHPHAPLSFFLSPPPSTAPAHRPPPSSPSFTPTPFSPHQILTYIPATSHTQRHVYPTYYSPHQNELPANPPPQLPPHTTAVSAPYGLPGRGSTQRGRGFASGRGFRRGRGGGRESFWSERNRVGRVSKHEQYSKRGMQNEGNRHKIVPLKRDEEHTTVMIKNIPYDCPRKELVSMLDSFCSRGNRKAETENEGTSTKEADEQPITYAYDFLYLPIDFRTKKSRGFAFVNFTNARAVWSFFESFHLKKWDIVERLKWPKQIEIVSAKIQGKEALVNHFSESFFECETDEFLPLCFSPARDGSGQPVELTVIGTRRLAARWKPRYNHKA